MRSHRHPHPRPAPRSAFAGYRFPPEVITLAVRWYLRFGLSYRDVEELLAERGVDVDHVTVYRWFHRFAPEFALRRLRREVRILREERDILKKGLAHSMGRLGARGAVHSLSAT